MKETLKQGQTFPEAISEHLDHKEKQRVNELQGELAPLKEEYGKNHELLEILGIEEIFAKAAKSINLSTKREAGFSVSPEPKIVTDTMSPRYRGLNTNEGSCTITLSWKDSEDGKREVEHAVQVQASNGNRLTVSVGIHKLSFYFETLIVNKDISYADLLSGQEQEGHLRDDSKHALNQVLYDAYLEAKGKPTASKSTGREPIRLMLV